MPKAKRERRERTDNYHLLQQWCRTLKQRLYEGIQPKSHPFKAASRHERWCIDIRYIEKHRIPEIKDPFYVITVMDTFSRAMLSSDIFQSQDLACVFIVLYAAVEQSGAPQHLITDNGGVFRAKQLLGPSVRPSTLRRNISIRVKAGRILSRPILT